MARDGVVAMGHPHRAAGAGDSDLFITHFHFQQSRDLVKLSTYKIFETKFLTVLSSSPPCHEA